MTTTNGKRVWTEADGEAKRPYRLWDAANKRNVPHRYYGIKRNALNGALLEVRWGKVGTALEVYDCRTGALLGQYRRGDYTISITKP